MIVATRLVWSLTALALPCLSAEARADGVQASLLDPPSDVSIPETDRLVNRLVLATGGEARRVRVTAAPLQPWGAEQGRPEGNPLLLRELAVEGDAVVEGQSLAFGTIGCSHGLEPHSRRVDLFLPANGHATVTATFDVSDTPPWSTTDYRGYFRLEPYRATNQADAAMRPDSGTVEPRTLVPPTIRVHGRRGVRIFLTTVPDTNLDVNASGARLARNARLAIAGITDPPVPDATITLLYRGPETEQQNRRLAAVRVGNDGRFAYRAWRPRFAGQYQLSATYQSGRPDLADDYFCPRSFSVEEGQPSAETSVPRVEILSNRVRVTQRRTRLLLRCSGGAGELCTGFLRLEQRTAAGRRVLVTDGFSVEGQATKAIRLRLRRRVGHNTRLVVRTLPSDGSRPTSRTVRIH